MTRGGGLVFGVKVDVSDRSWFKEAKAKSRSAGAGARGPGRVTAKLGLQTS